jgi:abortive infection bacteriophage resistance protein
MKKLFIICFIAFSCSSKQKTTSIFQIKNCDVKKMKREMMGVVTLYNPVQIDLNQTIIPIRIF